MGCKIKLFNPPIFLRRGKMGTVGAVAVDIHGNVASATSTGGILNKMEGRVGDTPCVGKFAHTYRATHVKLTDAGSPVFTLLFLLNLPKAFVYIDNRGG